MLDMGFIHDVRRIAAQLPQKHQTLLFSATMPSEVEKLAMDLLHDPQKVAVDPVSSPVKAIEQYMYYVVNALVFSRTKYGCDRMVRDLKRAGLDAVAIHGDKTQNARTRALARFKTGDCSILVATDIAARGLDIEGLSHVINYDLPMEPEAYIHRIGRTGRAGHSGTAISFCCIDEYKQLGQVEKLLGFRLPVRESAWPMEITTPTDPKTKMPRPDQRPARVNMRGEAVVRPVQRNLPPSEKTVGSRNRPAQRPGMPMPVRRVNHKKGNGM